MLAQENFKCRASHRGEAQARSGTMRLGLGDRCLDTLVVIMRVKSDRLKRCLGRFRLLLISTTAVIWLPLPPS
jgi:hypothetical protein